MCCRGFFACDCSGGKAGYIGSLNNEVTDAKTFASWGADYLKVRTSTSFSTTVLEEP
jgi:alpha-galactosidase